MASEVKTNKISPVGSTVTLGDASDTFVIPASVTLDVNGIIDLTGATKTGFPGGLAGVIRYTAISTVWNKANRETALGGIIITKVIVEVQGAGGSGSSGNTAGNTMGGAGGGYARKLLDVSDTITATAVVGVGGTTVGVTNNPGVAGGLSNFGETDGSGGWATVIGNGGAAGTTAGGTGSAGGTSSGGDIQITGGNGTYGGYMGSGGDSFMGNAGITVESTTGVAGTGYGAGGGGGRDNNSGVGTNGSVIVWEYQ